MLGLMQQRPLLLSGLIEYAERFHGGREIVSRSADGAMHQTTYAELGGRARMLAGALERLGIRKGDRVATLAWNGFRHLELYFGVTGAGTILHTVNPRLFPEQVQYIIDHAEDRYVFFDVGFAALVEELAPRLPHVRGYVALCDRAELPEVKVPNLLCYEELLAAESADYVWPTFDENSASTLCYTSGTTGNPKGVLYSHRSQMLHTLVACAADVMAVSARDSILLIVPLFHANAWGLPFAAAATGAKLVLPGPKLDPESVFTLLAQEECTLAGGIPTIWLNLFTWIEQHRDRLDLGAIKLTRVLSGGTAVPRSTIQKFAELFGAYLIHAWGMTETSPIATIGSLLAKHEKLDRESRYDVQALQGRMVMGCEVRLVDDAGGTLPQDGEAVGELQVRGPWVISGYFKGEGGEVLDKDGWFRTGDVAVITPDGYVRDHRPLQGRREVGRRVDQLHRDRESGRVPPGGARGRRDRRPPPAVAGAPAAAGAAEAGREHWQGGDACLPGRQDCEVVDAGRRGDRRRAAAYGNRQAAENQAARAVWRLAGADGWVGRNAQRRPKTR